MMMQSLVGPGLLRATGAVFSSTAEAIAMIDCIFDLFGLVDEGLIDV